MNDDDTFIKLKLGHLYEQRDLLLNQLDKFSGDRDICNFDKSQIVYHQLKIVHAKLLSGLSEIIDHIEKEDK